MAKARRDELHVRAERHVPTLRRAEKAGAVMHPGVLEDVKESQHQGSGHDEILPIRSPRHGRQ